MGIVDKVLWAVLWLVSQVPAIPAPAPLPPPTPYMHKVLHDADIPTELWEEFLALAACESWMEPDAIGDHGNAKGLYQIHGYLWNDWAYEQGYVKRGSLFDPIHASRVAYAVGEFYSIPRGEDRWAEWSASPYWQVCQERAETLLY